MRATDRTTVVITGAGLLSPLGLGAAACQLEGTASGAADGLLDSLLDQHLSGLQGELREQAWRATLLTIAAARMALSGPPDQQLGVIVGTSLMDLGALERTLDRFAKDGPQGIPASVLHYGLPLVHASHLAVSLGLQGACETLFDPVIGGLTAIGMGYRSLKAGEQTALLAGGVDSPSGKSLFRLIDSDPAGNLPSEPREGCALFRLERLESVPAARGVLGIVAGFAQGQTSDNTDQLEDLVANLAREAFGEGEQIDLLLDLAQLPSALTCTMAAGSALACGVALSLLGNPLSAQLSSTGLELPLGRPGDLVRRALVLARGPSGQTAALALSCPALELPQSPGAGSSVRMGRPTGGPGGATARSGPRPTFEPSAITGAGVTSALALGLPAFKAALFEARSGVVSFDPLGSAPRGPSTAALVSDLPLSAEPDQRPIELTLAACRQALSQAGLGPDLEELRAGLYLGQTLSSLESWVKLRGLEPPPPKPSAAPRTLPRTTTAAVMEQLGLTGPGLTFASGCTGGLFALGRAARDAASCCSPILAGGCDSILSPFAFGILSQAKLLTTCPDPERAGRPFDRERDGEVSGEGSAFFVLESLQAARSRGARPLALVTGFGAAGDGHHFKYNKPDGRALTRAAKLAIEAAGLEPSQIGLVLAHASGFQGSDAVEVRALAKLFEGVRPLPPVVSIKGATGQPFAAGGPLQVVAALCAFERDLIPPTAHFAQGDEDDPFDHVPEARAPHGRLDHILLTSYGYGGGKAALVLSSWRGQQ